MALILFYLYCSVSNLDLRPLETPNISFRADVAGLRQSIKKFGKVDSRGCPLETAFAGKSQNPLLHNFDPLVKKCMSCDYCKIIAKTFVQYSHKFRTIVIQQLQVSNIGLESNI